MTDQLLLDPDRIAATALHLFEPGVDRDGRWLGDMFNTLTEADFGGAHDDTVHIIDASTDRRIDVTLDDCTYSIMRLAPDQLTLPTPDFIEQVLTPQVNTLRYGLNSVAAELVESTEMPTARSVDAAKGLLCRNGFPLDELFVVAGAEYWTPSVFDDKPGFKFHQFFHPQSVYVLHPSAFAFALCAARNLVMGDGGLPSRSVSSLHMALRWHIDVCYSNMSNRSYMDTFVGGTAVKDRDGFTRGVKVVTK